MSFYVVNQGVIQTADAFRLHCMAHFITLIADEFDEEPVAEMVKVITQAFEEAGQGSCFQEQLEIDCPETVFYIDDDGVPRQIDDQRAILDGEATPFQPFDLVEAS